MSSSSSESESKYNKDHMEGGKRRKTHKRKANKRKTQRRRTHRRR